MDDQGEGLAGAVGLDLHRVDHVLDEEQAPAAWLLLAGQLLLEVGLLGVAERPAEPAVGDPDDQVAAGGTTSTSIGMLGSDWLPYSIAFIAASLTAVLSRSSFAGSRPTPATASATRSIAWRSLPCSPGS